MSLRLIAITKYSGIGHINWKKLAQPVDIIASRPGLLTVAIEAMNSNNAEKQLDILESLHTE